MTRHVVLFGTVAMAVAAGFACSTSSSEIEPTDTADASSATPTPSTTTTTTPEGPAGTGANTGLPCDVQAVLENRCLGCHAGQNPGVAPLLTYSDLMAKAASDPTKPLAQLSLERMKSTTAPMPPKPAEAPDPEEIAVFEAWIAGGTKKGAMCTEPPSADAGTPPAAVDAGAGADGGATCTSGQFWTMGNTGSGLMNPGQTCQGCHQVMGGPAFTVAGTVFPSLGDPNNCNGTNANGTLTVIITDAQNRQTRIPVNAAGNFYTRARIRAPFRARVTDGTKTRAMGGAVTAGDCNRCHTANGANGAPGRILAP